MNRNTIYAITVLSLLGLCLHALAIVALGQIPSVCYTGVNLAGAEFGQTSLPGTYGQHYIYPNQDNNRRGFLGEFAVANSMIGGGIGDEAIDYMLSHIAANADVWLGWTWWAAGPWWGNYMFSLVPMNGGAERPAMAVLLNHIPIPAPVLVIGASHQCQFMAHAGFVYQPEMASDIEDGTWLAHGSATAGDGQPVSFALDVATSSRAIYRVRVERAP